MNATPFCLLFPTVILFLLASVFTRRCAALKPPTVATVELIATSPVDNIRIRSEPPVSKVMVSVANSISVSLSPA